MAPYTKANLVCASIDNSPIFSDFFGRQSRRSWRRTGVSTRPTHCRYINIASSYTGAPYFAAISALRFVSLVAYPIPPARLGREWIFPM